MNSTRGYKLLKLATQKEANDNSCNSSNFLNLPRYESTKGLDKFYRNLAIQGAANFTEIKEQGPKKSLSSEAINTNVIPNLIDVQSREETCQRIKKLRSLKKTKKERCTSTYPKQNAVNFTTLKEQRTVMSPSAEAINTNATPKLIDDKYRVKPVQRLKSHRSLKKKKETCTSTSSKLRYDVNDSSESDYLPETDSRSSSSDRMSTSSSCSSLDRNTDEANTSTLETLTISKVPLSTAIGTHTNIFFCIYCKKTVKRFARHLITKHCTEKRVIDILRYPSKHSERKNLISNIRNEGTFMYNTSKLHNQGDLIVTRRPNVEKKRNVKDYSPCPYCCAYFISNNLNRLIKNCTQNEKNVNKSRGIKAQSRSIQIEMDIQHLKLHTHVSRLLSSLKNDAVSETLKHDIVLLHLASHMCKKYQSEKHLKHYARQKLRQLARLLNNIKENNPEILDMKDCLQPKNFPIIITAVQKICNLNEDTGEFEKPSLANHLGMHLKECTNILYSMCIIEQDDTRKKLVNDFKELMALEYGASISRSARKTLDESKWNKPKLLPVTSDIQIFRNYLVNKAESAKNELECNGFSYVVWRTLVEITAALVLIFNRKRPGETERILLSSYYLKQSIEKDSEGYETLTTLEKLLCSSFKRVEIRGKLGRRVPILLRDNIIQYIDTFIKFRKEAGVDTNIYLFGIDQINFVRITDIIRRESACSGAGKPELLRATYLRKQVATTSQVLDLTENEMQMLADFMGHDIQIHKSHYRTPELTLQVARLSKLLIAVDEGDLSNYKDKNLRNIDVTKYLNVTQDTDVPLDFESVNEEIELDTDVQSSGDHVEEMNSQELEPMCQITEECMNSDLSNMTGTLKNPTIQPQHIQKRKHYQLAKTKKESPHRFRTPPKQKIKRTSWKTPEKRIVRRLFKNHLESRSLPAEREVVAAIRKESALCNRTAMLVKAWINNQNKKQEK